MAAAAAVVATTYAECLAPNCACASLSGSDKRAYVVYDSDDKELAWACTSGKLFGLFSGLNGFKGAWGPGRIKDVTVGGPLVRKFANARTIISVKQANKALNVGLGGKSETGGPTSGRIRRAGDLRPAPPDTPNEMAYESSEEAEDVSFFC